MSTTDPRPPKPRPAPLADHDSAPYWTAAHEGRLSVQRCHDCGAAQLYGRVRCVVCGSFSLSWEDASGRGTVYSFTVIRQNFQRPFVDMLPYVVALVDLEEGPRLMTNIVGCDVDAVTVGMPVRVRFEAVSDEASVPLFEPAEPAG